MSLWLASAVRLGPISAALSKCPWHLRRDVNHLVSMPGDSSVRNDMSEFALIIVKSHVHAWPGSFRKKMEKGITWPEQPFTKKHPTRKLCRTNEAFDQGDRQHLHLPRKMYPSITKCCPKQRKVTTWLPDWLLCHYHYCWYCCCDSNYCDYCYCKYCGSIGTATYGSSVLDKS